MEFQGGSYGRLKGLMCVSGKLLEFRGAQDSGALQGVKDLGAFQGASGVFQ